MKKWMAAFLAATLLFSFSSWGWAKKTTPKDEPPPANSSKYSDGTILAFSLKVLQQMLETSPAATRSQEVANLAGITMVQGYVVDEANHDLILFGEINRKLPPLHLDDLVVALRNAWLKYATLTGNTYYYSDPGCSIDPNPQVIEKLNSIGNQINQKTSGPGVNQGIQNWHGVCRSPQQVRVLGIPFDTHFAWVMVKADYDMKQLVDGSDKVEVPGLESLTGMTMDLARNDIEAGRAISIPLSSMNRFWFHPGKNLYEEDSGVVMIKQCPVILLTEEEHLGEKGQILGKGAPDPLAHEFCQRFSAQYAQVAQKRPIYLELENLFRFVALAKIMKFKSAHTEAGLDLGYLLDRYQVHPVTVNRQLPGRSHVEKFQLQRNVARGYQICRLWLPSCGGVGIEIKISPNLFSRNGNIDQLKAKVVSTRPTHGALFWPLGLQYNGGRKG
ncbi:MAG: DUF1598 domain-containing protein [Desulfuromonadaceae bacterium]